MKHIVARETKNLIFFVNLFALLNIIILYSTYIHYDGRADDVLPLSMVRIVGWVLAVMLAEVLKNNP